MPKFSRAEMEEAFATFTAAHIKASKTGNWDEWADMFTDDAVYTEHAYGEFHGKEEIKRWIVEVMAPYPTMSFPHDWVVYDEENGAIISCVQNRFPHPDGTDNDEFQFPNWTRVVYAGNGKFSSEEDVYNPFKDAPGVQERWLAAGGKMASPLKVRMKHVPRRREKTK